MYSLQSESEGIATDLISFDTAHVTNSEYANCQILNCVILLFFSSF